jgi:hypothetical protein
LHKKFLVFKIQFNSIIILAFQVFSFTAGNNKIFLSAEQIVALFSFIILSI